MNTQRVATKPKNLGKIFKNRTLIPENAKISKPTEILETPKVEVAPYKPPKRYISTFKGKMLKCPKVKGPKENLIDRTKYSIQKLKKGWLLRVWTKSHVKTTRSNKRRQTIVRQRKFLVETEHLAHSLVGIAVHGCLLCLMKQQFPKDKAEFDGMWNAEDPTPHRLKSFEDRRREREQLPTRKTTEIIMGPKNTCYPLTMPKTTIQKTEPKPIETLLVREFEEDWARLLEAAPLVQTMAERKRRRDLVRFEEMLRSEAVTLAKSLETTRKTSGRLRYNKFFFGHTV